MNPPHISSFGKSKESSPEGGDRQHGLFFHPPWAEQLERGSSGAVGICDTLKAGAVCPVMGEQCIKLGNRNLTPVVGDCLSFVDFLGLGFGKEEVVSAGLYLGLVSAQQRLVPCCRRNSLCWDTAVLPG